MSIVNDAWCSTVLALADGRIRCAFAAHTFCSIAVGSSASSTRGACRAVSIDDIRRVAADTVSTKARVGRAVTLFAHRAVCRRSAAWDTCLTKRLCRVCHFASLTASLTQTARCANSANRAGCTIILIVASGWVCALRARCAQRRRHAASPVSCDNIWKSALDAYPER